MLVSQCLCCNIRMFYMTCCEIFVQVKTVSVVSLICVLIYLDP